MPNLQFSTSTHDDYGLVETVTAPAPVSTNGTSTVTTSYAYDRLDNVLTVVGSAAAAYRHGDPPGAD